MEKRHTTPNIAAQLQETTTSWAIQDKVKAVVHDGASNMRDVANLNTWIDMGCSAHKLHLAVTGAMGIGKVPLRPLTPPPQYSFAGSCTLSEYFPSSIGIGY